MAAPMKPPIPKDHVDLLLDQWARERPDLDVSSMGVFGRMGRLLKHLEKARSEALSPFGFNEGEFDVLATLRRSGLPYTLSPTQLYRSLMLTSGAITNRLTRLESAGWIERVVNPADGRGLSVHLSANGLAVTEAAVAIHVATQEMVLGGLSDGDRQHLARLLKAVLLSLPGETISDVEIAAREPESP
jgi:DNA-binding MarR family transcriptional regulator